MGRLSVVILFQQQLFLLFFGVRPFFLSMSGYNIISLCFTQSLFSLNSFSLPACFYPSWALVIFLFVLFCVVWAFLHVYVVFLNYFTIFVTNILIFYFNFSSPFCAPSFFSPSFFLFCVPWSISMYFFLYLCSKKAT